MRKRLGKTRLQNQRTSVPPVFSFTGHETFVFRYGWLTKAVVAVSKNPAIFGDDDAIVTLGVGKNMVRSIRHWALATGVLQDESKSRGALLTVSEIGSFLFGSAGRDPYLEDPATLWLLHWQLLSHPNKSTTWKWAFSSLASNEFTRASVVEGLVDTARKSGTQEPSESSIRRDVEVFIRTYLPSRLSTAAVPEESLDCPLAELDLLEESHGIVRFARGPKESLPDAVFAFAVVDYWRRIAADRESLSFSDLLYGFCSPGVAFKFDENSLVERLEGLEIFTAGDLLYADTAGLKQLYRRNDRSGLEYLDRHYGAVSVPELVGV